MEKAAEPQSESGAVLRLDTHRRDGTRFGAEVVVDSDGRDGPSAHVPAVGQRRLFPSHVRESSNSPLACALLDISAAGAHLADTREVARRALTALMEITGSRRGFVARWDAGVRRLALLARDGGDFLDPHGFSAAASGLWGWILETGRAVMTSDASGDPRLGKDVNGDLGSFLGVPVRAGSEILGLIALTDPRTEFTEGAREAAERIGLALSDSLQVEAYRRRAEALAEENRSLRCRLSQAERFEGLGLLFGGLAHDFNNQLTLISGYGELLQSRLGPGHALEGEIGEVLRAARSAGDLTRWLLGFGRHRTTTPCKVDLHETLEAAGALLRRLLGEDIRLEIRTGAASSVVRADPIRLEQLVFSLAVRARGVMPEGGHIIFETRSAREPDARGGAGVELLVSDAGAREPSGMLDALPFLDADRQNASCRAAVEGIVAECGGTVSVSASSGEGTTFRIVLPLADIPADGGDRITVDGAAPAGTESILVVEDEEGVRDLLVELLEGAGYRVRAAGCGLAALETADAMERAADLLIADLVLPDIGGAELRDMLVDGRPDMRTLFVSGYSCGSAHGLATVGERDTFLAKPFSGEVLLRHVRAVLDRP